MIIITGYTENGPYPERCKRLTQSMKACGLEANTDFTVYTAPDQGGWYPNVEMKLEWIGAALIRYRQPICWIDADAVMKRFPTELYRLAGQFDFACYNWCSDADNPLKIPFDADRLQCSGGVLYFSYSSGAAWELLIRWKEMVKIQPHPQGMDPCLDGAYNAHKPPVRSGWLPSAYLRIAEYFPKVEPVIDFPQDHDGREHGKKPDEALSEVRAVHE